MTTQTEKAPRQKAADLEKRVAELERMWSQLKWAATVLGTAVMIVTGVGYVKIPRWAAEEAVKKVTPDAVNAAAAEVKRLIPQEAIRQLDDHKLRAKQAADQAEKYSDRVKKIEGFVAGTTAAGLQTPVRRLESLAEGAARAFVFYDSRGIVSQYNIAGVDDMGAEGYRFRFAKPPGHGYVVMVSVGGSPQTPFVWDNRMESFNIRGARPDHGIFCVVYSPPSPKQ